MRRANFLLTFFAFAFLATWLATPLYGGEPAMTAEDLVAKHLNGLGSAEARGAAKTRVVRGALAYRILVGGGGRLDGKMGLVTDGHKVRVMLKLAQPDYKGENFAFNGDEVQVAYSNAGQTRSLFATFIYSQDAILREGLLGGVLSTGWALSDLSDHKAKVEYQGLKKVDGHQLYELRYWSRKSSDLEIRMYFEPETFHHVKTIYSLLVGNNVGPAIYESADLKPDRTTLEERFSDFQTVDGLSLPTHWTLEFTRELPNSVTTVSQWDLQGMQITNNLGIDPLNFKVQ
jgi:hypothetical protein